MFRTDRAYEIAQEMKRICQDAGSKQVAKSSLEHAGLWFDWVEHFRPYMDLPNN